MDNNTIKEKLVSKLKEMLNTISDLKIKSQLKLKILKLYVPAQISFDLKIYDIPISWLTSNLDNLIVNSVNSWLALPVSSCTRVILELPKHKGGHDVQLPSSAQLLRNSDSQLDYSNRFKKQFGSRHYSHLEINFIKKRKFGFYCKQ